MTKSSSAKVRLTIEQGEGPEGIKSYLYQIYLRKFFGNIGNWTRAGWAWSVTATSVLCFLAVGEATFRWIASYFRVISPQFGEWFTQFGDHSQNVTFWWRASYFLGMFPKLEERFTEFRINPPKVRGNPPKSPLPQLNCRSNPIIGVQQTA